MKYLNSKMNSRYFRRIAFKQVNVKNQSIGRNDANGNLMESRRPERKETRHLRCLLRNQSKQEA